VIVWLTKNRVVGWTGIYGLKLTNLGIQFSSVLFILYNLKTQQ